MKARVFAYPLMFAAVFLIGRASGIPDASPHRLSGHPGTVERKLAQARAQVIHDRRAITSQTETKGWVLVSAWPFTALEHRRWLVRDLRYVGLLEQFLYSPAYLRTFVDACTAAIVDRENPGWDPGRWNTQGSGAFGLPQAKPYSKMPKAAWPKSAGGREDPFVQLAWMVRYETERYGSPCAALAYWNAHGSY